MRKAESRARLAHLLVRGCVRVCVEDWRGSGLGWGRTAQPSPAGTEHPIVQHLKEQFRDWTGPQLGLRASWTWPLRSGVQSPAQSLGLGKTREAACVCVAGAGDTGRGGKEMLLNLKQGKEEKGQWDHRGGEFLKSLEFKDMEDLPSTSQMVSGEG